MDFKLIGNNIFEFYDSNLIEKNQTKLNGAIIYFPFKDLSYKSLNFFWYLPNKDIDDINLNNLFNLIKLKETTNGSNFIEGIEVLTDGPYRLNFIDFGKLTYKINRKNINQNLDILYLELFL